MATVKHIKIRNQHYWDAITYLTMQHNEFTNKPILDELGNYIPREEYLIEGINCDPYSFAKECESLNHHYRKNQSRSEIKAHHYIVSFDPDDAKENHLTMERAQSIGMKIAEENFPGHQMIVCTHPEGHNGSGNIHVHIVINSVRKYAVPRKDYMTQASDFLAGSKHRSTEAFLKHLKQNVMTICQDEGLHQVDLLSPARIRITDREYWAKKRGERVTVESACKTVFQTEKELLREKITSVLSDSRSLKEFSEKLYSFYGITFYETRGKISYVIPDREKPIRGQQLGVDFEMDYILAVIERREKILRIDPSLRLVDDLQNNIKAMQIPGYARRVKLTNLQQMARTVAFLQENRIGSIEELHKLQAAAQEDYSTVHSQLLTVESRLKKVNMLIRYNGQYLAHKAIYQEYLQTKSKQQFRSEHESELLLYEGARKALRKEYGTSQFPSKKELYEERQELQLDRNRLYEENSDIRRRVTAINNIENNVRTILLFQKGTHFDHLEIRNRDQPIL